MSGFTADWLRLREPFDIEAREASLLAPAGGGRDSQAGTELAASHRISLCDALAGWRRGRGEIAVLDLGSGTGANLRFTAPRLGGPQQWTLVDHDPGLLGRAFEETRAWARSVGYEVAGEVNGLRLLGTDLDCRVTLRHADLAPALEELPFQGCDLVTASALLDLVSRAWLARLIALARAHGCALLAALTYDGRIRWDPADPGDGRLRPLVNRHQRTDKGFGPALGPEAPDQAIALMESAGYQVATAASDWRIGPADREIQRALLEGWVEAAQTLVPAGEDGLGAWRERRLRLLDAGRSRLTVGHRDLFGRL